ncbi:MAG: hypothetical protein PVG39_31940 [Desulfobacteraceae bacterium]|jgi:hypothetical protein
MKNKNEIDLARLFADISEPTYDDDFTKKVIEEINRRQHRNFILRASFILVGILILAVITPWLIRQTGFIMANTSSFINVITEVCLSPAGWVISSMVLLYSILKTRLSSH